MVISYEICFLLAFYFYLTHELLWEKKNPHFFQNPYRFDTICLHKYVLNIFFMLLIKSIILMLILES
jgi:hypothetical protein